MQHDVIVPVDFMFLLIFLFVFIYFRPQALQVLKFSRFFHDNDQPYGWVGGRGGGSNKTNYFQKNVWPPFWPYTETLLPLSESIFVEEQQEMRHIWKDKKKLVIFMAWVINATSKVKSKTERIQFFLKATVYHLDIKWLKCKEVRDGLSTTPSQESASVVLGNVGVIPGDGSSTTFWMQLPLKPKEEQKAQRSGVLSS